jgi:hypothetical protein
MSSQSVIESSARRYDCPLGLRRGWRDDFQPRALCERGFVGRLGERGERVIVADRSKM